MAYPTPDRTENHLSRGDYGGKAIDAGATPNDTTSASESSRVRVPTPSGASRDPSIEHVEHQRYRDERGGQIYRFYAARVLRNVIAFEDCEHAAEAVGDGEEVRQLEGADHREVPLRG
jgi:hypothetical protein